MSAAATNSKGKFLSDVLLFLSLAGVVASGVLAWEPLPGGMGGMGTAVGNGVDGLPGANTGPATAKKELRWNSSESRFYLASQPFSGMTTDYYPNGKLRLRWAMKEGKMHGLVEEFNDKGVQVTSKYYQDGLRHGETRYYYPEGQLMKVVQYSNDAEVGHELLYNRDGSPLQKLEH